MKLLATKSPSYSYRDTNFRKFKKLIWRVLCICALVAKKKKKGMQHQLLTKGNTIFNNFILTPSSIQAFFIILH